MFISGHLCAGLNTSGQRFFGKSALEAEEKFCTGRESNSAGAKAGRITPFTARLKSCPDTKHEFFRSLLTHWK